MKVTNPILSPTNSQFLKTEVQFNQLTDNQVSLTLEDNIASVDTPKLILDGVGRAQLNGAVSIDTSSVEANMPLVQLPPPYIPQTDQVFPVVVLRDGALIANAIYIESAGNEISSVSVTAPGSYTTIPTASLTGPGEGGVLGAATMKQVSATVATAQSSTGSYAPGDTLTISGGTSTAAATRTITHTKVVSATVAAAGSGGTPGSATVTGTTGTGTKFQAAVTISGGGAISSVNSISVAGDYTVNPTDITQEPVTGGGLTGAQLSVKVGVLTTTLLVAGSYTVLPSNPVSTTSSGSGTGATLTMGWGVLTVPVTQSGTGYDSTSGVAFSAGAAAASLVLGDSTAGAISLITQPVEDDVVYLNSPAFLLESY